MTVKTIILFLFIGLNVYGQVIPGRSWSFRQRAASAGGPFGGLVSTNSLVAAWRMDEPSDGSAATNRLDSFGANTLVDISPYAASATGLITNAVDLETSNSEALTITDNAALSMPSGTSFTITGWIKPESNPTTAPLISKGSGSGAATEYQIWANSTTDFRARVGDTSNQATVTNTVTPSTGVWFFIAFRCDLANDLLKLRINSTDASVAYTGDTVDGSSSVNVGRVVYSASNRHDGLIDGLYVWKRVLTDDEITALYNSGAGLDL